MITLKQSIGDDKIYRIPLRWEGAVFTPGTAWTLIFGVKADPESDLDAASIFQKATDAGITHDGDDALVTVVPRDTQGDPDADPDPIPAQVPGVYHWGIRAQNIATGERRYVREGVMILTQAVVRDAQTAVPIYTDGEPHPSSVEYAITAASTIAPITGDEIAPALSGGVLGKFTYTAIKTWVLSGLQIAWGSITGTPTTLAGYGITDAEPAKGADDNYVTDAEKTNIGNLGTAAYTASTDYAASNKTIFALTSDVHIDHTTGSNQTRFDAIATQIEAENPPFVFFNGDTIDLGVIGLSGADLALIHASFDVINAPKYFAIGNHDTDNGDSITDVTAGSTARFYTAMRAVAGQGDTLGYYSFEADGIDYIVINSVELQAPTEGDYDISSTQKIWIQTTLAALRGPHRKLVVFSHVDPTETSSIYYRMPAATRSFLQGAFSNWAYSSGGRLLAVLTAHEHGANNASANRARTVGGVAYWNIIDGLNNGSSNIKALTSAAAPDAKKGWWKVQWNQAAKLFAIIGQNTMTDLSRTASILPAPAFQRFNGTNHAYSSGIVPDSTTEMVVVGRFRSTSGTQTMGVANGSERFYFGIISGTWYLGFGTAVNSGVAADTLTHEWKINSTGLFLDGVQIATAGAWATTAIVAYFASVRTDSNNVNFCSFDYTRGSITKAGVTTYFYPTLT